LRKIEQDIFMREILLRFWTDHSDYIFTLGRKALFALAVVAAAKILVRLLGRLIQRAIAIMPQFDETFASILKIVVTYTVSIVALIIILDAFGVNTASLIALLGAAGVAVGLALKDTLSNIAAGIILLLRRSYKKGDFIEFGSTSGTVKTMDLFATILETPDGVYISAPNSGILAAPLKNYTRNNRRRMDLVVGISYTDSIDTAFAVMREIIAAEHRFLPQPAPQIMVQSLGDSSVNIMLRAWARTDTYWTVFCEQTRNMKEKIEAAGLNIPFPQQDIHIRLVR
jgi:small conductance mechanosensitive channel